MILYYRLKLNEESTVKIAVTDPDDDYVRCHVPGFVQSGIFSYTSFPGVTINEVSRITFF